MLRLALVTGVLAFVGALPGALIAAGDPVIAAAGDISCDPASTGYSGGNGDATRCHMRVTSDLLVGAGLSAVLPLGDNQYYCGSLLAYQQSYDPTWGRVKAISHPAIGNHEYITATGVAGTGGTGCGSSNSGAAGHFGYWGPQAGPSGKAYYSYDIGGWHLIALNSNCGNVGGCDPSSAQGKWLAADLAANTKACTLAYWHIPLFSSGGRAAINSKDLWTQLAAAKADVVLNGHDHIYERFAPQNADGVADVNGIREFIAGTGGSGHTTLATPAANTVVTNTDTFGVLKLTLHPAGYDWSFVPEPGKTFTDSGSAACHRVGAVSPPPSTSPIRIDLKVKVLRSKKGVRRVTARLIRPRLVHAYFVLRVDGTMSRVRVRIVLVGQRGRIRGNIVRRIPTNRPVRLAGLPVPSLTPSMRVAILS